eukprot:SAG31_NODE_208_length_20313_cov_6.143119_12_plen_1566_part_00
MQACAEHWCFATVASKTAGKAAPIVCLLPTDAPQGQRGSSVTRVEFAADRRWTAAEIRQVLHDGEQAARQRKPLALQTLLLKLDMAHKLDEIKSKAGCHSPVAVMELTGEEIDSFTDFLDVAEMQRLKEYVTADETQKEKENLQAAEQAEPSPVCMRSRFLFLHNRPLPDSAVVPPGSIIHSCHYNEHEISQTLHVEVPQGLLPTSTSTSLPLTALISDTVGSIKATLQAKTMVRADTIQLARAAGGPPLSDDAVLNNELSFANGNEPRLKLNIVSTAKLLCEIASAEFPLLAPDDTLLADLLPPASGDTEEAASDGGRTVYVTFRKTATLEPARVREHAGRLSLFANSLSWAPAVEQTVRGASIFLSSLCILTNDLSSKPDEANSVVGRLAAVLPFPPALAAFKLLIDKRQITEAHQAALAQAIYTLTRHQLPPTIPDETVFEGSLCSLAWLVASPAVPPAAAEVSSPSAGATVAKLNFEAVDLTCDISHTRLEDPVELPGLPGEAFSRTAATELCKGGCLYQPGGRLKDAETADLQASCFFRRCLLAHPGQLEVQRLVGVLPGRPGGTALLSMDVIWNDAKKLARTLPYLRLIPAANLRNAPRPSLALDTHGHVTVSVESGHSSAGEISLFQPLTAETVELDSQTLQDAHMALPVAEGLAMAEELQFDAVECDEAIVFCLDVSNSMDDHCGFLDKPPDEDDDSDTEELDEQLQEQLDAEDVGPALRQALKAGADDCTDEDVIAEYGTDVFTAMVELRCHANFGEIAKIFNAFKRSKRDQASIATEILIELCREVAGGREAKCARAELVAKHLVLFLKTLLRPALEEDAAAVDENALDFMCPITQQVMCDPVFAADGYTYERAAIMEWLEGHSSSPMTGVTLTSRTLTPNRNLKSQIAARQQTTDQQDSHAAAAAGGSSDGADEEQKEETDEDEDDQEDMATKLVVLVRGRPVAVHCSDLTSVRALTMLTERAVAANGGSGSSGSNGGFTRLQLRLGSQTLKPDRTLRSYGIVPGGSAQNLKAVTAPLVETFEVTISNSQSAAAHWRGRPQTLVVRSDETARNLLWRLAAAAAEDSGQLCSVLGLFPSRHHLWAGLESTGDGHASGRCCVGADLVGKKLKSRWGHNDNLEVGLGSAPMRPKGPGFLSRLLATKQLFHALVNRTEAYAFNHRYALSSSSSCFLFALFLAFCSQDCPDSDASSSVGLVLFGSETKEACQITSYLDSFKHSLDDVESNGDTCCYDALLKAADMLKRFKTKHPRQTIHTKLRIVCLSDGKDNKSAATPATVAAQLQADGVLLDTIMIGKAPDDLRAVAKATGGYAFHPTRLKDALMVCELETMLRAAERPPVATALPSAGGGGFRQEFRQNKSKYGIDLCDDEHTPPRRAMPGMGQRCQGLSRALDVTDRAVPGQAVAASPVFHRPHFVAPAGMRRLMREMRGLATNPHPSITVLPGEVDISFWHAVVEGPDGTPCKCDTFSICACGFCLGDTLLTRKCHLQTQVGRGYWRCHSQRSTRCAHLKYGLSLRSCTATSTRMARSVTASSIGTTTQTPRCKPSSPAFSVCY